MRVKRGEVELNRRDPVKKRAFGGSFHRNRSDHQNQNTDLSPVFFRREAVKRQQWTISDLLLLGEGDYVELKPGQKEPFATFFYFFSLFFLTFSDYQCIEIELINAGEKG